MLAGTPAEQKSTQRRCVMLPFVRLLVVYASAPMCVLLGATPAGASCDDRPGTPNEVRAVATSPTTIELSWTNTTRLNEAPNMCFDIYVSGDSVNRNITGGACAGNVGYGSRSSHVFTGLVPGTTYYFSMRARTAPGTEGCISALESNPSRTWAWTPTQPLHDRCDPYAKRALEQVWEKNRKRCQTSPGDLRWTGDRVQHYAWCIERTTRDNPNDPDREIQARDQFLATCRPPPDIARAGSGTVPIPQYCDWSASITVHRCRNLTGSLSESFGPRHVPGCGRTEDEAVDSAKLGNGCLEETDDPDAEPKGSACCTYTAAAWLNACDCGRWDLRTQSVPGALQPPPSTRPRIDVGSPFVPAAPPQGGIVVIQPPPAIVPVAPDNLRPGGRPPFPGQATVPVSPDVIGPRGLPPFPDTYVQPKGSSGPCPAGMVYRYGRCQTFAATAPQPAPQPTGPGCLRGMIGTPPNCRCPAGTVRRYGGCIASTSSPRVATPTPRIICPAGTRPAGVGKVTCVATSRPMAQSVQRCRVVPTCVQWGRGRPGMLAGPCVRYENRQQCTPNVK